MSLLCTSDNIRLITLDRQSNRLVDACDFIRQIVLGEIKVKLTENGGNRQTDSHLRSGDLDINRTFFQFWNF